MKLRGSSLAAYVILYMVETEEKEGCYLFTEAVD